MYKQNMRMQKVVVLKSGHKFHYDCRHSSQKPHAITYTVRPKILLMICVGVLSQRL